MPCTIPDNLPPEFRTNILMKFPVNLTTWKCDTEEEIIKAIKQNESIIKVDGISRYLGISTGTF